MPAAAAAMDATGEFDATVARTKREIRSTAKKRITFDSSVKSGKSSRQSDNPTDAKADKKSKDKLRPTISLDDEADNQGFSDWLRSTDGIDMMRLFVLANSLVVLVTMAWPQMKQTYEIILELIYGEEEQIMLALLFRGVFLIGVIGWYSASLWRTVDSYFKSQFQRYLDEEYARNPRMRDDVRTYATAADKAASDLIVETACGSGDVCPIDKADPATTAAREVKSHEESGPPADSGAGAAAEIEVARPTAAAAHTDQPAFRDSPVVDEAEPPTAGSHEEMPVRTPPAIRDHRISESSKLRVIKRIAEKMTVPIKQKRREQKTKEAEPKKEENQSSPQLQKGAMAKKRSKIATKSALAPTAKPKIKQREKIPTLKLSDNDFREFDSEDGFVDNFADDDDEDFNGIPLKDLPFKPMIDVYDLERVSEEEYCPLSLDDDPTCDELRSWP